MSADHEICGQWAPDVAYLFLTTTNWVKAAGISVKFSARVSASTISIPCLTLFEDDEVLGNLAQISQFISQSPEKA